MALVSRFSSIDKAILTATGNSLVVCGSSTVTEVNTSDMITSSGGTTRDWTQNGSSANLSILTGSKILYAELIWHSTVKSNISSAPNLISAEDTAITFTTPNGTNKITPIYTDTFTGGSGSIDRFRSADVTSIVAASLSGKYTVSGVPASIPTGTGLSNTRAGWTLAVIYKNASFKPKYVNFSSGIANINGSTPMQTSITGFYTSSEDYDLKGNLFAVCANGEPLTGNSENLKLGSSFVQLINQGNSVGTPNTNPGTAPNNPYNNFFSGQINVCNPLSENDGIIDVTGTDGNFNHDAFVPTQVVGARNKWDITDISINKSLVQNQNLVALQVSANNTTDGIEMLGMGAQVSAVAPNITVTFNCFDDDGDYVDSIEVGDNLVYIIQIKNAGDAATNNFNINTNLPASLSYIGNSFTINGTVQQGIDIVNGVNIGSIGPKGVTNVAFRVKVASLPQGNSITPVINYNFQFISGSNSPLYTNSDSVTLSSISVYSAVLNAQESVSKSNVSIGDTIDYTVNLTNKGTVNLTNIMFQNMISQYCTFVTGSVYVDGVQNSSLNPNSRFSLQDIAVGQTRIVKFSVKVNTLSPSASIGNSSAVTYSYNYDEFKYSFTKTVTSNDAPILVQYSDIIGNRVTNNNYPNIGDTVTYTLTLTNIGNVDAVSVQVAEPTVEGATFVAGSVTVNGSTKPNLSPFTGFSLDSIAAQATTTITYGVLVNEIPPENLVLNSAKVPFKYQIQAGGTVISDEKDSNKVITRANYVTVTIPEAVDRSYATIGDEINYSVDLTNTGNINAFNTIFLSNIQAETQFVTGSVKINGLSYPSYNPNVGFSVGVIAPYDTINVKFKVKVLKTPKSKIVYNNSELVYSAKPDPNGNAIVNTVTSNIVQTMINQLNFSITKTADKGYAKVGDVIVYTVAIENTGTVTLSNVIFGDKINSYSAFRKETVSVDSISYVNYDPNSSFNVGDINPGDTLTVIFAVDVKTLPPSGYVANTANMIYSYRLNPDTAYIVDDIQSNTVYTNIINGNLSVTKVCNKQYAAVGDTLTYYFTVSNTGNVTLNNAFFTDNLPAAVSFVSGSVTVNDITKASYDPTKGFSLGSLTAGQVYKVAFKVNVASLPVPNTVINYASVAFNYYVDPSNPQVGGTSTSNTVTTTINAASVTMQKYVDKAYASIGDILSYSILLQNTGTVNLTGILFTDIILPAAQLVADSVKINGVSYSGYDPNNGFNVLDISVSGAELVEFKAKVMSLPTPNTIINTASMSYNYLIDPAGTKKSTAATSNSVTTIINTSTVTNTKTASKSYATNGDTITYTSVIKNNGNVTIKNTNFLDSVPQYTTFTTGTVKINGNSQNTFDPNAVFTLGDIAPGAAVTVSFDVVVAISENKIAVVEYVTNNSNLSYKYNIDPSIPATAGNALSNTVKTNINTPGITVVKTADRSYARVNDTINYTFVVTNTGDVPLSSISFKDTIQTESSFNTGSVYIDGVQKQSYNPNTGFSLEDIGVGDYSTITFSVKVNSIPSSGKILNTGTVNYSYYVDPSSAYLTGTATSNQTTVNVNDTIVSATKAVDKAIAKIGDVLNFSFVISNAGNVPAQNVVFKDILDSNLNFVSGSVIVNSSSVTGVDPNQGFSLSDIAANGSATISFQAKVAFRPSNNIINNSANVSYSYVVGTQTINAAMNTNNTTTYVAVGELTVTKAVSKSYATVPDTLTYTVNITNTGSVAATNLNFSDVLPAAASFKAGTVKINNAAFANYDPTVGFSVPDLSPNQINIVTFDISVNSVPASGEIDNTASVGFTYKLTASDSPVTTTTNSNTVTTYIKLGTLTITKSVDKAYATLNDVINYTINIQNTGNVTCSNIVFTDQLQQEAALVQDSVYINNKQYKGYNPNNGFSIPDMKAGDSVSISFQATVNALPSTLNIYNNAKVSFNYLVDPSKSAITYSTTSNTVDTIINIARVNVTKTVSSSYATVGDTLTYTVNVFNNGTVNITNVNFRDVIPVGTTFITDSVTIDGVTVKGYDPYQSFTLGAIVPGDTTTVSFKAQVTSLPSPALIGNTANVVYTYRINPTGSDTITEVDSNTVTTQINVGSISITKAVDKYYTVSGSIITYNFKVTNTGNVDASNVTFIDNLQAEVTFNANSVSVNGKTVTGADPNAGFSLGTIPTLTTVNVSFTVTVNSNPSKYVIVDFAQGIFSYYIDPNGQLYTNTVQSNAVASVIVIPSVTATKNVDLAYATIGDLLDYKILVKNTGNVTLNNVAFVDNLSAGTSVQSGSVLINGISESKYDPIAGFVLPDIVAGDTCAVEFKVQVTTVPTPPQVTDYATINATYKIDPSGADNQISTNTNTVATQINAGVVTVVKAVDKAYAQVNEIVTYTNTLTNAGNVNVTDLWFYDNLPDKATFVPGSVSINGVINSSLNPEIGFNLGILAPQKFIVVEFTAKVTGLPANSEIDNMSQAEYSYKIDPNGLTITNSVFSNIVKTQIVKGELTTTKTVDKGVATINDTLNYSVTITNTGNVIASNVVFQDVPSTGAVFNAGSVTVNGTSESTYDVTKGFTISSIGIGNTVVVTFSATVTSVPASNAVTNQAVLNFNYLVDPKQPTFAGTSYSNTVTTNIAIGKLNVVKAVDKDFATIGDILTYTITITNIGNINATNITFVDSTPNNSIFVVNSVYVNGVNKVGYSPAVGFDLNVMKPGEIITVIYQVKVIS